MKRRAAHNKGTGAAVKWLRDHAALADGDCLYWPFSRTRGYGAFGLNGETHYAHRYMCELANGPAPTSEHQAAHSCGNGHAACVHPRHLSWKTKSENEIDKRSHGTSKAHTARGVPRFALTKTDAERIRSLSGRLTQDEIATMFGVTRRTIGAVLAGKTWTAEKRTYRIFTEDEVRTIRNLRGVKQLDEIAAMFNAKPSAIWRVQAGKTYSYVA
jgi:hypothetical protein